MPALAGLLREGVRRECDRWVGRPAGRPPGLAQPTQSYSTIVTIECAHSARYRPSSCSRDVALMVAVSDR